MAVANEDHVVNASDSALASTSANPTKNVRAVAFKEDPPEIREVRIDEDEVQDRWYSNGEYFFIKKEALSVVRRMSSATVQDTNSISTRGLEIIDDRRVKVRKKAIDGVVKCILEAQRISGSDPEYLAPLYQEMAQPSVRKSLENANCDAKDAEQYLADTKKQLGADEKTRRWRFRLFDSLHKRFTSKNGSSE